MIQRLPNFIGGGWQPSGASQALHVLNPASAQVLAEVPLSPAAEVDQAVETATRAFAAWRRTPAGERIQPLFKLKALLEQNIEDLARTITNECGKTLRRKHRRDAPRHRERGDGLRHPHADAGLQQRGHRGRHRRAHDPPAAGRGGGHYAVQFPGHDSVLVSALRGGGGKLLHPEAFRARADDLVEAVSPDRGRRFSRRRDPTGERRPRSGGRHPRPSRIRAVSFVGSTATARYIYSRAAANGKRAQCQGGAKNPVVMMPDADMEMTTRILADSAFGCAGQRCLAASVAITVGDARPNLTERDGGSRAKTQGGLRAGQRRGDGAGDLGAKARRASKA